MADIVPVVVIADNNSVVQQLVAGCSLLTVDIIESRPSYTSYLKVLQYLPVVVVMELPKKYHDQLHFLQMFKQNTTAHDIPVICFGEALPESVRTGLKKIGVDEYLVAPFDPKALLAMLLHYLKSTGISVARREATEPSIQKLAASKTLLTGNFNREEKISLMMKHIGEVMAFPFTLSTALKLVNDDSSGIGEISKVIEVDPALTARFLKMANSASYAGRNARVAGMKDAIVRIGLNETRRIVSSMAAIGMFGDSAGSHGFDRFKFWMHCMSTAVIADELARMSGKIAPGEAFLAGLLHDFGIIMLDEFFPAMFKKALQKSTDRGIRFYDAEKEIFGIDHNDIVGRLFEQWKIPEPVTDAVVNHYRVTGVARRENFSPLVKVTAYANMLSKCFRFGLACDLFVAGIENDALASVNLATGIPPDLYDKVFRIMADYERWIHVAPKGTRPAAGAEQQKERPVIGIADLRKLQCNPVYEYLRRSGYILQPVNLTDGATGQGTDPFAVAILFVDSSVNPHMVESLQKSIAASCPAGPDGSLPVLIVNSETSPCLAVAGFAAAMVVSDAIDLRMLDVHVDTIINRRNDVKLQGASHRSVAEDDAREGKIKKALAEQFRAVQIYREKCLVAGVNTADCIKAAEYIEQARSPENSGHFDTALEMLGLAADHYERAWLRAELDACEKRIAEREKSLGVIG